MVDQKSAINKVFMTLDATGTKPENLVKNEAWRADLLLDGPYVTVTTAPFYETNFKLVLIKTNNDLVEATRGVDFEFVLNYGLGERIAGKHMWFAVKIMHPELYVRDGSIYGWMTYQAVGSIPFTDGTDNEKLLSSFSFSNGNFSDLRTVGITPRKEYLRELVRNNKTSIDAVDVRQYENPLWWKELPVLPTACWMALAGLVKPQNVVTIKKPNLVSPSNGSVDISLTPTLVGSAFQLNVITPPGGDPSNFTPDTIDYAEFQIWDGRPGTGSLVHTNTINSFPISIMDEIPVNTLVNGQVYNARVRYRGHHYPLSDWSDLVAFTTVAAAVLKRIATPSIISADALTPVTGKGGNFLGSRFMMLSGADEIVSSDWELFGNLQETTPLLSFYNQKNTNQAFSVAGVSMNPDQTESFSKTSVSVDTDFTAIYSGYLAASGHALLVKLDDLGDINWEIATAIDPAAFLQVKHDSAGNIITHGHTHRWFYPDTRNGEIMDVVVSKFDPFGTLLWSKVLRRIDASSHDVTPGNIAIDSDDNIIVTGSDLSAIGNDIAHYYTHKFSTNGALQWSNIRKVTSPGNSEFTTPSVMIQPDNSIVVAATATPMGMFNVGEIHCWKLDAAGVLKWNNKYVPEFGMPAVAVTAVGNTDLLIGSNITIATKVKTNASATSVRAALIEITKDGDVVGAKTIADQGTIMSYTPMDGSTALLSGSDRNSDFYLVKIDRTTDTTLWGKTSQNGRSISYYDKTPCSVLVTADKVIAGFANVGIYEKNVLETPVADLVYDNNIFNTVLSIADVNLTFGNSVAVTKTASVDPSGPMPVTVSDVDLDLAATATTVGDYDIAGFNSTITDFPGLRAKSGDVLTGDTAVVRVRYNGASAGTSSWSDKYEFALKKSRPYMEVKPPVIALPALGQNNVDADDLTKSFTATPFEMATGVANPHHAIWEIFIADGNDPHDTVVINDTATMNVLPFTQFKHLTVGTGYYVRVMYVTDKLAASRWSGRMYFNTNASIPASAVITKPVITLVDATSESVGTGVNILSTPFAMDAGVDTLVSVDWEVYSDALGENIQETTYGAKDTSIGFSAQGPLLTSNSFNSPNSPDFNIYGMYNDSKGNVYYTARNVFGRMGNFASIAWELTSDIATRLYLGLAFEKVNGQDDNIITFGVTSRALVPNDPSHLGIDDVVIAKYSSAGALLWNTKISHSDSLAHYYFERYYPNGVAIDGEGNIIVTCLETDIADFKKTQVTVHKLNAAGNLVWSNVSGITNPDISDMSILCNPVINADNSVTVAMSYIPVHEVVVDGSTTNVLSSYVIVLVIDKNGNSLTTKVSQSSTTNLTTDLLSFNSATVNGLQGYVGSAIIESQVGNIVAPGLVRFDASGTPVSATIYKPADNRPIDLKPIAYLDLHDGTGIVMVDVGSINGFWLIKVNQAGGVIWGKQMTPNTSAGYSYTPIANTLAIVGDQLVVNRTKTYKIPLATLELNLTDTSHAVMIRQTGRMNDSLVLSLSNVDVTSIAAKVWPISTESIVPVDASFTVSRNFSNDEYASITVTGEYDVNGANTKLSINPGHFITAFGNADAAATYSVRVRHNGFSGNSSAWSDLVTFTKLPILAYECGKPNVITPDYNQVVSSAVSEFVASDYVENEVAISEAATGSPAVKAIWEIFNEYPNGQTDSILVERVVVNSKPNMATVLLTSFTTLQPGITYYVRMRYLSSKHIASSWSDPIAFTVV